MTKTDPGALHDSPQRLGGSVALFVGANAVQAGLAIALLPLATLVLSAADFGAFALVMALTSLATALSDGGGGLTLPAHYAPSDTDDRRRLVATVFCIAIGLASALALLFLLLWPWRGLISSDLAADMPFAIAVACAIYIPLRATTSAATVVFAVSGRGRAIAGQILAQSVANFAAVLICLFVLKTDLLALFVGAAFGQVASVAFAGIILGSEPWRKPSRKWFVIARGNAPTAAAAGLADGLRLFVENALIARTSSLQTLGYFAHARLYQSMALTASNALSQNIWAISLAEARDPNRTFERTGRAWSAVHFLILLAGLGSVALGEEVVAFLTNGVLSPAAAYLPWLITTLLIHLSGRPALAVVFASGLGGEVTRVRALLVLFTVAALPFVVSTVAGIGLSLGIWGLIGAALVEATAYRLYLRWRASFSGRLPFQDIWVVLGIPVIVASTLLNSLGDFPLQSRIVAFVVCSAVLFTLNWVRGGPMRFFLLPGKRLP